jgi:polar amino acid transport system substrate-binding protein
MSETLLSDAVQAPGPSMPVPAPGESPTLDAIRQRQMLRVATIEEFPWLVAAQGAQGPPFSGPAWLLVSVYARRLGVTLTPQAVSNAEKITILATKQVDMSIAPLAVTEARKQLADFIAYSTSSLCFVGSAANPKLANLHTVDDLNRSDLTMGYLHGTPMNVWGPQRFPRMQFRGFHHASADAPVREALAQGADVFPVHTQYWHKLSQELPGTVAFPKDYLQSTEFATPMAVAIDKGDPVFYAWLTAVYHEIKAQITAEEARVMASIP